MKLTVDRIALAARILTLAEKAGSERKLAAMAGMNERNLSVIRRRLAEKEDAAIELNTLERIATGAGVPLAEFLGLAATPGVAVGELPGWADAEKEARRSHPAPEHVWAWVREVRLPDAVTPSPAFAAALAAARRAATG